MGGPRSTWSTELALRRPGRLRVAGPAFQCDGVWDQTAQRTRGSGACLQSSAGSAPLRRSSGINTSKALRRAGSRRRKRSRKRHSSWLRARSR